MKLGSFDLTAQPDSQKKPFIATEKRFTWQEMQIQHKKANWNQWEMNWITGQKHILARVQATGKVTEPAVIKILPNAAYPFLIQSHPRC